MALWTGEAHTPAVVSAAAPWKEACLFRSTSVFTAQSLWTAENLANLRTQFVDNPLTDNRSFYDKLQVQIGNARPEVAQLAAEVIWLLFLFPHKNHVGTDKKKQRIEQIWGFSKETLPKSEYLAQDALSGIGAPGAAFLTKLDLEFGYLLAVSGNLKGLPEADQARLSSDPDAFCRWITSVQGGETRAIRHMLLFLCFPKAFERIASRNHKMRIHDVFSASERLDPDPYSSDRTPCGLDKSLLAIRRLLEAKYGTAELDFYREPLRAQWFEEPPPPEPPVDPQRHVWIEKTIVRGRPDRQEGEHRVGSALWSPQRSKSGSDIYANMRAVEPGDLVLHLTDNEAFAGVSKVASPVDETFLGLPGTSWGTQPSYRVALRDYSELDPELPRQAIFGDEKVSAQLKGILERNTDVSLFYNGNLELNQGAYLTAAPQELVALLNNVYERIARKPLPHFSVDVPPPPPEPPYTLEDALKDLFVNSESVQRALQVWRRKKNLIIQGPPGVGKTFTARRLAFAHMGAFSPRRTGFVQFHQSYSYEDFVQGYRPEGAGFELKKGRFLKFCIEAAKQPTVDHVFVIDEINRGNLSKIFGELMMLIEVDKRSSEWAVPLAYDRSETPFFVPPNVYLLGLMNTADRSLAVVDYALRRRFAFFDLRPQFETEKFSTHLQTNGITAHLIGVIRKRIGDLNDEIVRDDTNLGRGFCIGHSFFCGRPERSVSQEQWYRDIVDTEIVPLLQEYWFDSSAKVSTWRDRLLARI